METPVEGNRPEGIPLDNLVGGRSQSTTSGSSSVFAHAEDGHTVRQVDPDHRPFETRPTRAEAAGPLTTSDHPRRVDVLPTASRMGLAPLSIHTPAPPPRATPSSPATPTFSKSVVLTAGFPSWAVKLVLAVINFFKGSKTTQEGKVKQGKRAKEPTAVPDHPHVERAKKTESMELEHTAIIRAKQLFKEKEYQEAFECLTSLSRPEDSPEVIELKSKCLKGLIETNLVENIKYAFDHADPHHGDEIKLLALKAIIPRNNREEIMDAYHLASGCSTTVKNTIQPLLLKALIKSNSRGDIMDAFNRAIDFPSTDRDAIQLLCLKALAERNEGSDLINAYNLSYRCSREVLNEIREIVAKKLSAKYNSNSPIELTSTVLEELYVLNECQMGQDNRIGNVRAFLKRNNGENILAAFNLAKDCHPLVKDVVQRQCLMALIERNQGDDLNEAYSLAGLCSPHLRDYIQNAVIRIKYPS